MRFLVFLLIRRPSSSPLFPFTTLFRSRHRADALLPARHEARQGVEGGAAQVLLLDRKSTRLNSSHVSISYAVFCWNKKSLTLPVLHAIPHPDSGARPSVGDDAVDLRPC